jgi:hypothetical protein
MENLSIIQALLLGYFKPPTVHAPPEVTVERYDVPILLTRDRVRVGKILARTGVQFFKIPNIIVPYSNQQVLSNIFQIDSDTIFLQYSPVHRYTQVIRVTNTYNFFE